MNAVLSTLGTKLTERIAVRLVMPGLLYVGLCLWAARTGHRHALDPARIGDDVASWAAAATPSLLLAVAAVLAVATTAGALATVTAQEVVIRVWTARRAPTWLLRERGRAWDRRFEGRDPPPPGRYRPQRLTPLGDTFRLVGERVDAQYGLSVPDAWPRLMILAGPDTRSLLTDAHRRFVADAALAAWAIMILPWAVWWWPALPIAAVAAAISTIRAGRSARVLAALIESVVDVHQRDLAASLGVELPENRLTPAESPLVNNILTKRA